MNQRTRRTAVRAVAGLAAVAGLVRAVLAVLAVLLLAGCGQQEAGPAPGRAESEPAAAGATPDLVVVDRLVPLPARHREAAVETTPEPLAPRHVSTRRRHAPALSFAGSDSEVRWSVELTGVERLELGYYLTSATAAVGGFEEVELTVAVHQDGEETRLFRALLRPEEFPDGYRDASLSLQGFGGAAELVLTSRSLLGVPDDRVGVSWVSPRLLARAPAGPPGRNVVVLCIDTLRADRMELFGGERSAMPRVERRIRGGAAAFTRAYANAPWSLPSMATLLTGRFPGHHFAGRRTPLGAADEELDMVPRQSRGGIELVIGGERYRYQMLHPSIPTLQEALGARGYLTGALHHNGYINYPTNVLKGMDGFFHYGVPDAAQATDHALEWMRERRDTRFFLFLHYMDPHDWPPQTAKRLGEGALTPYREELRDEYLATYDELVGHTDVHVDRLLAGIEALGLGDETYLVLTSDHGELFFDGPAGVGHGSSLRDPVLRVPLALWGPGLGPSVSAARVSLADVAPTLLDLVDVPVPAGTSGRSLLPVLRGRQGQDRQRQDRQRQDRQRQDRRDRDFVAEYRLAGRETAAFFSGPWKLLYDLERPPQGGRVRLRNLAEDPGESRNLAGRRPAVEQRLRRQAERYLARSNADFEALRYGDTFIDQETIDSLRALGYIR